MKKFIANLLIAGILCVNTPICLAECSCTSSNIVDKLKSASSSDLQDILGEMVESYQYPNSDVKRGFAHIIYSARNEKEFQAALRDYITTYCSVSGNNIICR